MTDIRKKHQAPRGWFGQALLIVAGIFVLWQLWLREPKLWPIFVILIPAVLLVISHLKRQRRRKIIELKKNRLFKTQKGES